VSLRLAALSMSAKADLGDELRRYGSYLLAKESLRLQLTKAQQSNADLRKHLAEQGAPAPTAAELWELNRMEGGAPGTGLETMVDKYNSASGDH
jgi:hypothetical protein